jgi:hypothetical protein
MNTLKLNNSGFILFLQIIHKNRTILKTYPMKKMLFYISFLLFISMFSTTLFAGDGDSTLIENRDEARALFNNFHTMYKGVKFEQKGGSVSIEALEKLIEQAKANNSTEVVYYFARTTADESGKNILLFFNTGYPVSELDGIDKFKTVKLCPTDCDKNVEEYLK